MRRSEISLLLGVMAAYDRRTTGETDVAAWLDVIGDLDFADAVQAVKDHYRESSAWVMPADVRHRVKKIREERLAAVGDDAAVPDADPDDVPAYLEALRAGRMRRASPPTRVASNRVNLRTLTANAFREVPDGDE
jgi:hypothetical protein